MHTNRKSPAQWIFTFAHTQVASIQVETCHLPASPLVPPPSTDGTKRNLTPQFNYQKLGFKEISKTRPIEGIANFA